MLKYIRIKQKWGLQSMKVLYIETAIDGHHQVYLKGLVNNCKADAIVFLPEKLSEIKDRQYTYSNEWKKKSLIQYIKWILKIRKIVTKENPDIIHFLDGDTIMRYMGLGFFLLKRKKLVITYHHFFSGIIRRISYKLMTNNAVAVAHTQIIKDKLTTYGVKRVFHIEYPVFKYDQILKIHSVDARKNFGIKTALPVLGVIGATDGYKGIDILIQALKHIENHVCLFVAGKEGETKKEKIYELNNYPNVDLVCKLGWMTEQEYILAICACDYIVLPYKKIFDGASGPLVDGVVAGKTIIGADHGSLGETIRKNKLGYTFESENIIDLAKTIDEVVGNGRDHLLINKNYIEYLNPRRFYNEYDRLYRII